MVSGQLFQISFIHAVLLLCLMGMAAPQETSFTMPPFGNPARHPVSGYGKSAPSALLMQWVGPKQYPPFYETKRPVPTTTVKPKATPVPPEPTTVKPPATTSKPTSKPSSRPPATRPTTFRPPVSTPDPGIQACASDPLVITVPQSSYLRSNLRLPKEKKVVEMVGLMLLIPVANAPTGQPTQWVTIPLVDPVAPFSRNPYRWPRPAGVDLQKPKTSASVHGGMGDHIRVRGPLDDRDFTDTVRKQLSGLVPKLPFNTAAVSGMPSQRELIQSFMNFMKNRFGAVPPSNMEPSETANDHPAQSQYLNQVPGRAMSSSDLSYQNLRLNPLSGDSQAVNHETGSAIPGADADRTSNSLNRFLPQYYRPYVPPEKASPNYIDSPPQWPSQSDGLLSSDIFASGHAPEQTFSAVQEPTTSDSASSESIVYKKVLGVLANGLPSIPLNVAVDIAQQLSQIPELGKTLTKPLNRPLDLTMTSSVNDESFGNRDDSSQGQQEEPIGSDTFHNSVSPEDHSVSQSSSEPGRFEWSTVDLSVSTQPSKDYTTVHEVSSTDEDQKLLEAAQRLLLDNSRYAFPYSTNDVVNDSFPHVWNIKGSVNYFNFPNPKVNSVTDTWMEDSVEAATTTSSSTPPSTTTSTTLSTTTSTTPSTTASTTLSTTTSTTLSTTTSTAPSTTTSTTTSSSATPERFTESSDSFRNHPDFQLPTAETSRNSESQHEFDTTTQRMESTSGRTASEEEDDVNPKSDDLVIEYPNNEMNNMILDDLLTPQEQTTEKETSFVWNVAIPTPFTVVDKPLALTFPNESHDLYQAQPARNSTSPAFSGKIVVDSDSSASSFGRIDAQPVDSGDGSLDIFVKFFNVSEPLNETHVQLSTKNTSLLDLVPSSHASQSQESLMGEQSSHDTPTENTENTGLQVNPDTEEDQSRFSAIPRIGWISLWRTRNATKNQHHKIDGHPPKSVSAAESEDPTESLISILSDPKEEVI